MGLGPHSSSLLKRASRSAEPISLLEVQADQGYRSRARIAARISHAAKHKAKVKPLAPVEETDYKLPETNERLWKWTGEQRPAKLIPLGWFYTSVELRNAGFKLPKLGKR